MAKKITIYIEDTDIKLLVTTGNKTVKKWASLLLEPSLVSDGVIIDEDGVASSIKEILKLGEIKAKNVIAGLSGLNSIFRVISLPEMPKALLPEAIRHEAARVIPLPLDQVYLSYQPIPAPKGETNPFFLVAYPRNSTDSLIRTLHKAGLKPHIMDLAPLALCRCANEPKAIIVNARLSYLDIVIMVDRIPEVIRSLSLPTDAVSLPDKLPAITEELDRTIAFYNSSNPEKPLDSSVPVFVSGDLSDAQDSWQSLAGTSGYHISELPSPLEFPPAFKSSQFMVNMGLALKGNLPKGEGAYSSIIDFNALPEAYRPPPVRLSRILTPVATVAAIGALAFIGLLIRDIGIETNRLDSRLDAQNIQLNNLRSEIADIGQANDDKILTIAATQEQVQATETQLELIETDTGILSDTFDSLGEGLLTTNYDLREIVNLLPATIDLSGINYNSDSTTISGQAQDKSEIFSYARALRSSGRFYSVLISSIKEDTTSEEAMPFSFDFLLISGGAGLSAD